MKAPVIAGKYTLLRRLGQGGMAEVFLAKQKSEGGFEKLVVLKRILPHLCTGPGSDSFVAMFLDEARLASDLRHSNIVNVFDVDKTGATYFMVMEFLHGQDVRKFQRKHAHLEEMIPLGHACQIAIDAAAGLFYAHKKLDLNGKPLSIVHRDVSPQNILLTYEGATKIVDFGIAKAAGQSTHTSTGVLKGKYTYMSPEQAAGEIVDARTDQFALGIVLWELLTMRRLFKRESEVMTLEAIIAGQVPKPSKFRDDVPRAVEDVVMTALATDRKHRFADLEAFALALEDALTTHGITHSSARLGQYMRRIFADTIAEEASIGLVQPDGALSQNLTPFTLPPAEAPPRTLPPAEAPRAVVDDPPTAIAETNADRKSARESQTGSRKAQPPLAQKPEPKPEPKRPPETPATDATRVDESRRRKRRPESQSEKSDRVVARSEPPAPRSRDRDQPRDRGGDRGPDRDRQTRRMLIAAGGGLSVVAAVVLLVAWGRLTGDGPGTLVIRSEPRGATVFLNDVPTGQQTPALLRDVAARVPHKLRLELSGHEPFEDVVTLERKGTTLDRSYALSPAPRSR